jgi:arginyl-tRNA synthetase
MLKEKVYNFVVDSIKNSRQNEILADFNYNKIVISRPELREHGDFSTNLSFVLSLVFKRNPQEIAKNLIEAFQEHNQSEKLFKKIEVVNGFINFFLNEEIYYQELKDILKRKNKYGNSSLGNKQKIQIEFISANPTGPLTVGNARGGPLGDCLANVLKKAGFVAKKEYYVNNCGNQITILGHSILRDELAEYRGEYIDRLGKEISGKDPDVIGKLATQKIIYQYIKKTTDRFKIIYDKWFFEDWLHKTKRVKKIINILTQGGFTYLKDQALWFKSTSFGDTRDRVLIKTDGQATYLAVDIAYHYNKLKERKFDKVINVWGADHHGDVAGLKAGVSAIGFPDKLEIILLQFVTLYQNKEIVKMSKRTGVYVTMDELLDMVGVDAARYFFLSRGADTHLNFDIDVAQQKSDINPVFYIQYAYARICNVLKKAKNLKGNVDFELLNHPSELELMKTLAFFPEIIEDIAVGYQAQRLPQYGLDLASAFHRFYQECRVITDDKKLSNARLSLVLSVKIILKQTLDLMRIGAPEKM